MTATLAETLDVSAKCAQSGRNLGLTLAAETTIGEALRVAAAGHHVLDDNGGIDGLQLRREGEEHPLDENARACEVLTEGDALIVEPSAAGQKAAEEHEKLSAAAGTIAGESVSASPRQFLKDARHPIGE